MPHLRNTLYEKYLGYNKVLCLGKKKKEEARTYAFKVLIIITEHITTSFGEVVEKFGIIQS
jgi:hypothetical protein